MILCSALLLSHDLIFGSSLPTAPEPHMPHVLMEEGDLSSAEYEQHLKGRNDFIKGTKKDPSAEKKVSRCQP